MKIYVKGLLMFIAFAALTWLFRYLFIEQFLLFVLIGLVVLFGGAFQYAVFSKDELKRMAAITLLASVVVGGMLGFVSGQ